MSEPYDAGDEYAEAPDEGVELDDETVEEMYQWAADRQAERDAAFDEQLAETERAWQAEEDAAAAQEREAEIIEHAEQEAAALLVSAAEELGVESMDARLQAYEVATKLLEDRDFRRDLADGPERAQAAIRAGVEAMATPKDEVDAARRYMTRKKAPRHDDGGAALELAAPLMGLTQSEKRAAREAFGIE